MHGACLVTSTLLVHRLQIGKVIEGYLVFDAMRSYLRHYWCSVDGVNHDLGSLINKRLGICVFKDPLSQMPPVGYQNMSKMDEMELKELEAGFRCYTVNPKVYWKRAPRWIRALKGF